MRRFTKKELSALTPDALRWLKSGVKDLTINQQTGDTISLKDADHFPNLKLIGEDVFFTNAALNKAKREAKAIHHPINEPIKPDPGATARLLKQINQSVSALHTSLTTPDQRLEQSNRHINKSLSNIKNNPLVKRAEATAARKDREAIARQVCLGSHQQWQRTLGGTPVAQHTIKPRPQYRTKAPTLPQVPNAYCVPDHNIPGLTLISTNPSNSSRSTR